MRTGGGRKVFRQVALSANTPTELAPGNGRRLHLWLRAAGATVYLGRDSSVNATGFPLGANEVLEDPSSVDAWWGYATSAATVSVCEVTL